MKRFFVSALAAVLLWQGAFAATSPFKTYASALSNASALGGTEKLVCIQGGSDVICTPAQIQTFLALGTLATANAVSPPALGGTTAAAVHASALTSVPIAAPTRDAGNVGYVLVQGGIPVATPSSGSIGNNGALTGLVAMIQYPNCFMWFPANAIASGVAAGFYYVQMTGTTAGTIFNNTYTSGTPAIPGSPTAFVTTGPGAFAQTLSVAQNAISISLPANSLGPNGELQIDFFTAYVNDANAKTFAAKLGASSVGSTAPTTTTNTAVSIRLRNLGSGAVQTSVGQYQAGAGLVNLNINRTTVDTTSSQTITLTQMIANVADFAVIEGLSIKVFPN